MSQSFLYPKCCAESLEHNKFPLDVHCIDGWMDEWTNECTNGWIVSTAFLVGMGLKI